MAERVNDAELETHINGFLTALGERPEELIPQHVAQIEQPNPQDANDLRRYVNELKRVYGQGLLDMYRRIESHGRAICGSTDEAEITERVTKIMALVAVDGADVPKVMASFDEAGTQLNPLTIVRLLMTIRRACAGELPRQAQRDELILDLTTYCLTRFPPS